MGNSHIFAPIIDAIFVPLHSDHHGCRSGPQPTERAPLGGVLYDARRHHYEKRFFPAEPSTPKRRGKNARQNGYMSSNLIYSDRRCRCCRRKGSVPRRGAGRARGFIFCSSHFSRMYRRDLSEMCQTRQLSLRVKVTLSPANQVWPNSTGRRSSSTLIPTLRNIGSPSRMRRCSACVALAFFAVRRVDARV